MIVWNAHFSHNCCVYLVHQAALHCCRQALTMFAISVEILKDGAFKSLKAFVQVSALCVILAGEGKEPVVKRCLSGCQDLGVAQGMQEAWASEWVLSGNKGHGTLKVLPLDRDTKVQPVGTLYGCDLIWAVCSLSVQCSRLCQEKFPTPVPWSFVSMNG